MARQRFYRRLTRNRSGLGTYSSLWLGPDHLLLVVSTGFSETYQRFYFRDIQSLVVADSGRFMLLLALAGCGLLLCGVPAAITLFSGSSAFPWLLVPTIPTLIIFLWNLALGRTCKVHIVTGVQTVPLPPLSRFRRTRRVFARIVPLIEAAQASLVPPPIGGTTAHRAAAPEIAPDLGAGAASA